MSTLLKYNRRPDDVTVLFKDFKCRFPLVVGRIEIRVIVRRAYT